MYRIGDFLIQLKNAYSAGKKTVEYPYSNVAESIGKILEKEGYIEKITTKKAEKGERKFLIIELKYDGRIPAISDVKLVSKPSVHEYIAKNKLGRSVSTHGVSIISTSQGMMTNRDAIKKGVGGELICRVF